MKFGLLGTGNWGKHYARLLPEYGELVILDKEIDPSVDCVVIATPASTHKEYIKKALKADKHILVEKPMVFSVVDAEEVKSLLKNKVFMIAHQLCYHDFFKELISVDLKFVNLVQLYSNVRQDVNAWWDIAPHFFSVIDLLKYEGDFDLILDNNSNKKICRWAFIGNSVRIIDESKNKPQTEPLRNEIEHFINCVKTGKTPLTDMEHALRVIRNIEKYETQYAM